MPAPILARCCLHQFWSSAVCTNSGPVLPTPILAWCSPHQFWPGALRTNFDQVLSSTILALCCPHQFWLSAVRTNSGPVLFTPILARGLSTRILGRCCLHQFWPDVTCTSFGPMLPSPILARCYSPILAWCRPHKFWPTAAHNNSGQMQPAPIPTKCSPHLGLPSAAHPWLNGGSVCWLWHPPKWRYYALVISHPLLGVERISHHLGQNKNTEQTTEWNHRTRLNQHYRMGKQWSRLFANLSLTLCYTNPRVGWTWPDNK